MKQHESTFNVLLAEALKPRHHGWTISAESAIDRKRPDISLISPSSIPLIIEAEFEPADNVEHDARARFGFQLPDSTIPVETVIALHYPDDLRNAYDPDQALKNTTNLQWAVLSQSGLRFPSQGWLTGGIDGLARMVRRAPFLSHTIDMAVDLFEECVSDATPFLTQAAKDHPGLDQELARILCIKDNPQTRSQTRKMTATMLINAFIFHERLCGHYKIQSSNTLKDRALGLITPIMVIEEWQRIMDINYWPIFDITINIAEVLPASVASDFLTATANGAQRLVATGLTRTHDLTGTVFQRLIADRKFLATFYTTPPAAEFLAQFAIDAAHTSNHGAWGDKEAICHTKVADLACGTGTLLHAAYARMLELHEDHHGNPEDIHATMMENSLIGCDVLPLATHLTVSMLAGMFPHVLFGGTQIYTLPFGRQEDNSLSLGSIEMLGGDQIPIQFAHTPALIKQLQGDKPSDGKFTTEIKDQSFDVVIMNPPYSSSTSHEGSTKDIPIPPLAGLGTTPADQRCMAVRMEELTRQTCYSGNAGFASVFMAIAERKLRPGGRMALVMPLTLAQGKSWVKTRALFARHFTTLRVISIAAAEIQTMRQHSRSFSADTSIAELLVIADKKMTNTNNHNTPLATRWTNIVLRHKLSSSMEGAELALAIQTIEQTQTIRKLEDPPHGGTEVQIGATVMAEVLSMPWSQEESTPWLATGILDLSLAQIVWHLTHGKLWLLRRTKPIDMAITTLGTIANRGLLGRDINEKSGRGAFDIRKPCSATATYPALWNHDTKRERCLIVDPDSQGRVRIGMEDKAARTWQSASRLHHNADFGFSAQSLAMAMTDYPTIGGRAWPNIVLKDADPRREVALALWSNTTLGLLCYWWKATRTQAGRGSISLTAILDLPVLDVRTLSSSQLDCAQDAFTTLKCHPLLAANEMGRDEVRAALDRCVIVDILGLSEEDYEGVREIARKLSEEPSIHGGKKS